MIAIARTAKRLYLNIIAVCLEQDEKRRVHDRKGMKKDRNEDYSLGEKKSCRLQDFGAGGLYSSRRSGFAFFGKPACF
ncbi:hypothetical protein DL89DRAFT_264010 [Linderina pennispora]|uniref:Uncharacterized protein n=1 Tax=Linderina pennispora TaxID=61395 RepID=A0A1Y1WKE9_9FUNG|nr:uncharacterized protein DL89DRAFT_264010 [Linderina pennispora]ORX74017.1 hypothetical protein DL89DRAFT_264010 [Linderina pennispora]